MNKVQQARLGVKILRDWLGEGGKPVPIEEAQARTDICVKCPHNYSGPWVWNMATALAVASQLRLRQTMAITLKDEDKIAVCDICGCQLKLKVHTPFIHIFKHTSDEQLAKYPLNKCWIRNEYEIFKSRRNEIH